MGSLDGGCGGLWWGSKAGGQHHSPRGPGVLGTPPPTAAVPSSFSVYSLSASVPLCGFKNFGNCCTNGHFPGECYEGFFGIKAYIQRPCVPVLGPQTRISITISYVISLLLPVGGKSRAALHQCKLLFLAAPCGVRALWTESPHCSGFLSLLPIQALPEQILDIVLKMHLKPCLGSEFLAPSAHPSGLCLSSCRCC